MYRGQMAAKEREIIRLSSAQILCMRLSPFNPHRWSHGNVVGKLECANLCKPFEHISFDFFSLLFDHLFRDGVKI